MEFGLKTGVFIVGIAAGAAIVLVKEVVTPVLDLFADSGDN
jgi:hypothetical protein